jgi:hypothetical protein
MSERRDCFVWLFPVVQLFLFFFSKISLYSCTSFIEREHQPSLKAIKRTRKEKKKKSKKSHHELVPPEPPGLCYYYTLMAVWGGTLIDNHVYTELYTHSI